MAALAGIGCFIYLGLASAESGFRATISQSLGPIIAASFSVCVAGCILALVLPLLSSGEESAEDRNGEGWRNLALWTGITGLALVGCTILAVIAPMFWP